MFIDNEYRELKYEEVLKLMRKKLVIIGERNVFSKGEVREIEFLC